MYINERKLPLIVSNDDAYALIGDKFMPGAGASLQAIIKGCNLKPKSSHEATDEPGTYDLIGKPNPFTIQLIREEHGLDLKGETTVMIGDRPNTDILFGKAGGLQQCLVLSGVVRGIEDFKQNWLPEHPEYCPTHVIEMVGDLDATVPE